MMMALTSRSLREDALAIWHTGVEAVRSDRLVESAVRVSGNELLIASQRFDLRRVRRIAVVGGGKAGAGMAAGLEHALSPAVMEAKQLTGWINVPADCLRPLARIHLHAARPPGVNEPTEAGVEGTRRILDLARSLSPDDLCIALISGGASALLPAPARGITLTDKLAVTRHLAAAGADIVQLNTVRKHLSVIKGGGLARACGAGNLVTLILSDIPGDPLPLIGSGPTVTDTTTPHDALDVLQQFGLDRIPPAIVTFLNRQTSSPPPPTAAVHNFIIGSNATAVRAAADAAHTRGYDPLAHSAIQPDGGAESVGRSLADDALRMRGGDLDHDAFISGGESTVTLVEPSRRGLGGRNQQSALAALLELSHHDPGRIVILCGGTDGEDGPTDAAGAIADAAVLDAARRRNLDPADYLARNDAYHFFAPIGGLIRTGPTHTNVCDLRIVLVDRVPRG